MPFISYGGNANYDVSPGRSFLSGAPCVRKSGNPSMQEILVLTAAYACPSVQTLGEGEGRRMPSFLGGKSRGAFGQPAFFLAGNRMTIVALEKKGFFKSLSLFSKTIVRQY